MPSGSSRAQTIAHTCDEPLAFGSHDGGDSSSVLLGRGKNFKSCGVAVGMAIHNTTQDTDGLVTVVTEDSVTDDTNAWDNGDEYEIYIQTKDSLISTISVDRRFGRKIVKGDILDAHGIRPEDVDLDEQNDNVFGPLQPEGSHD